MRVRAEGSPPRDPAFLDEWDSDTSHSMHSVDLGQGQQQQQQRPSPAQQQQQRQSPAQQQQRASGKGNDLISFESNAGAAHVELVLSQSCALQGVSAALQCEQLEVLDLQGFKGVNLLPPTKLPQSITLPKLPRHCSSACSGTLHKSRRGEGQHKRGCHAGTLAQPANDAFHTKGLGSRLNSLRSRSAKMGNDARKLGNKMRTASSRLRGTKCGPITKALQAILVPRICQRACHSGAAWLVPHSRHSQAGSRVDASDTEEHFPDEWSSLCLLPLQRG